MIDLGRTIGSSPVEPSREKYYPSITINADKIKGLEVGKEVTLTIKAKVVGESIRNGQKTRYDLELREMEKV